MISIIESFYNEELVEALTRADIHAVASTGSRGNGGRFGLLNFMSKPTPTASGGTTAKSTKNIPVAPKKNDFWEQRKAQWKQGATVNKTQ